MRERLKICARPTPDTRAELRRSRALPTLAHTAELCVELAGIRATRVPRPRGRPACSTDSWDFEIIQT